MRASETGAPRQPPAPRYVALLLAAASVLAASACSSAGGPAGTAAPTYNHDIAPLLWQRCGSCHRPGQMAPFSLLTYDDVKRRASSIAQATRDRVMPPWLPEPGYGQFADARRLTDEEIARIGRWVEEGAREGSAAERTTPPVWADAWQLGTPDLIVELPEAYTLAPGATDEFRNFVLPIPVPSTRYVRGIEVRPGNAHVVHHATIGIDTSRASRLLDEADPAPGYEGMFSIGAHSPGSHALGWTPGMTPRLDPPERAWRLDAGSDLVIQLHMMPAHLTAAETVRPIVAFYFSPIPPTTETIDFKLGVKTLDIPAGDAAYVVSDTYRVPVDVELLSVYPHAHYLGKAMKVEATLPDGRVEPLLWIRHWDFNWQDAYRYVRPIALPKGTTIAMQYTYDNSAANPRNPHSPPARVVYGPQSTDEMGDLWLRFLPRTRGDAVVLAQSFTENESRKNLEAAERGLADHPDDGRRMGTVGAQYVAAGRVEEGIDYLRRARRLRPDDAEVRNDLGLALRQLGQLDAAIAELGAAARLSPGNAQIHMNLADALQDRGDLPRAIAELRRALALNPAAAEPHNNLGVALATSGDIAGALQEFRRALEIRPDYADALANVAAAVASGRAR
ncbi:MAG TPA: tetratricopeptide repeat protein [Vicinamibacterales bacterium]|nr:tetratricopeptide repeat protein [Vicinamibacterales bacterium]